MLYVTVKGQCFRQSDVLFSGPKPLPSYSFPLEYKITNGRQVGCICWRQYCINQHCHNDQYSKYQLLLILALKTLSPTHKGDAKYPYYLMQLVKIPLWWHCHGGCLSIYTSKQQSPLPDPQNTEMIVLIPLLLRILLALHELHSSNSLASTVCKSTLDMPLLYCIYLPSRIMQLIIYN